jgi:hypothetical protein
VYIENIYLKLLELIGLQFFPGKYQPYHMLWQESEGAKVQHLIAMAVYKLKHLVL